MHIEHMSKNIGEHGRLQSLVETFIGKVARWWDTDQTRLQIWTTAQTYFVERFGGNNLTNQAQIPIFIQGQNPEDHIKTCEKEWRRLGYKDECIWPHMFPSTLDGLLNKWYKMEEAQGKKILWNELRENFIQDFSFILEEAKLV